MHWKWEKVLEPFGPSDLNFFLTQQFFFILYVYQIAPSCTKSGSVGSSVHLVHRQNLKNENNSSMKVLCPAKKPHCLNHQL